MFHCALLRFQRSDNCILSPPSQNDPVNLVGAAGLTLIADFCATVTAVYAVASDYMPDGLVEVDGDPAMSPHNRVRSDRQTSPDRSCFGCARCCRARHRHSVASDRTRFEISPSYDTHSDLQLAARSSGHFSDK